MQQLLSTYYPGVNSKTYYGLYSPPIRRFLLVDDHNLFALYKTAQVLSSKINTVVFILQEHSKSPKMTNDNCFKFGFQHHKFQFETSGDGLRQSPTAAYLRTDGSAKIQKVGLPAEFGYQDRKNKLLETQSYAKYVNCCMHATMLTSIIYQQIHIEQEHNEYNSFLYNQPLEPTLITHMMNILTYAENITEATAGVDAFLLKLVTDTLNARVFYPEKWKSEFKKFCTEFYSIMETEMPEGIREVFGND